MATSNPRSPLKSRRKWASLAVNFDTVLAKPSGPSQHPDARAGDSIDQLRRVCCLLFCADHGTRSPTHAKQSQNWKLSHSWRTRGLEVDKRQFTFSNETEQPLVCPACSKSCDGHSSLNLQLDTLCSDQKTRPLRCWKRPFFCTNKSNIFEEFPNVKVFWKHFRSRCSPLDMPFSFWNCLRILPSTSCWQTLWNLTTSSFLTLKNWLFWREGSTLVGQKKWKNRTLSSQFFFSQNIRDFFVESWFLWGQKNHGSCISTAQNWQFF